MKILLFSNLMRGIISLNGFCGVASCQKSICLWTCMKVFLQISLQTELSARSFLVEPVGKGALACVALEELAEK